MATILHSTQKSWKGPWLIEGDPIKELDNIISEYWDKLEKRRKKLLEKDVNEAYKSYKSIYKTNPLPEQIREKLEGYRSESRFAVTNKQFYIILSKDHERSYPCESFNVAFRERALLNETPRGFAVYLTSGDIICKIFVDHNTNKLEVDVTPRDMTEANELFTALYNWVDKHTNTPVQRFFELLSEHKWFFLVPYSALIFYFLIQAQDQSMEILKTKANDLLERGITQSNVIEAVETLLRIEAGTTTAQAFQIPSWFWLSVAGLIYLILILFLQPKVILGIGKGTQRIKLWRGWQGLMLITIPIFVLTLVLTFFGDRILQSAFP